MVRKHMWPSAGDFDSASMEALLEQKLGGWQSSEDSPAALPNSPIPEQQEEEGKVFLVDRPGLTQVRDPIRNKCSHRGTTVGPCFRVLV